MKARPLAVTAILALAACGNPHNIQVKTTGETIPSVADRKTYSHAIMPKAPVGYTRGNLSPEVLGSVRDEVDAALQQKGYVLVPDGGGELIVRIATGTRDVINELTGSEAKLGVFETVERERGISIDIIDKTREAEPLFHGYAHYDADLSKVESKKIRDAVNRILAKVPPSDKS